MHLTNHTSSRSHAVFLAGWLIVGLSLVPCPARSAQQPALLDPVAVNDAKLIERMEKLRARALKAPGGAIEASDFASYLTTLFTQGVAKRRPITPAIVDEAVRCLDQAGDAKPELAADLRVRKGELSRAAGRSTLISVIFAWVVIVLLGLGSLIIIGMAWEDAWSGAKLLQFSLGLVLVALAWVVWLNLASANLVIGWVLCIVLGILGPMLTWGGIDKLRGRAPRHLKQYLVAGGGISATVLAILVAVLWLGINNIAGWLLFLILGIVSLVLIGWSIYDFVSFGFKEATLRLSVGCISTVLTLVISYFWLRSHATLRVVEWVCFLIAGILGAAAVIWGLLMSIYGENRNRGPTGLSSSVPHPTHRALTTLRHSLCK